MKSAFRETTASLAEKVKGVSFLSAFVLTMMIVWCGVSKIKTFKKCVRLWVLCMFLFLNFSFLNKPKCTYIHIFDIEQWQWVDTLWLKSLSISCMCVGRNIYNICMNMDIRNKTFALVLVESPQVNTNRYIMPAGAIKRFWFNGKTVWELTCRNIFRFSGIEFIAKLLPSN